MCRGRLGPGFGGRVWFWFGPYPTSGRNSQTPFVDEPIDSQIRVPDVGPFGVGLWGRWCRSLGTVETTVRIDLNDPRARKVRLASLVFGGTVLPV